MSCPENEKLFIAPIISRSISLAEEKETEEKREKKKESGAREDVKCRIMKQALGPSKSALSIRLVVAQAEAFHIT